MTVAVSPMRLVRQMIVTSLALAVGGCSEYLSRRDASFGAGDAVRTNAAIHVIDPWPRTARRIDPYTDGERMTRAVERYRNPPRTSSAGGDFGGGFVGGPPSGPSASPSVR